MKDKLVVFISGTGSNLKCLIEQGYNIVFVISNNRYAKGNNYAIENNIPFKLIENRGLTRVAHEKLIIEVLDGVDYDLIVLAGYMRILTENFIRSVKPIINLHPAIPEFFNGVRLTDTPLRGEDCILKAFDLGIDGGVMCHDVITEVDLGEPISYMVIPRYPNDTFEEFEKRIKKYEKWVLMNGIDLKLKSLN